MPEMLRLSAVEVPHVLILGTTDEAETLLEFLKKPLGDSVVLLNFQDGIDNVLYFLKAIIFIQINIE